MFSEIIIHNMDRPVTQRVNSRRVVGSYRWRPSAPGAGRGFYTGDDGQCGDSTFRLRITDANDHIRNDTIGYYCDEFGDQTLKPIVLALPHGRGWLAGWTMGPNMCASMAPDIHDTPECAARAAHSMAESDAEAEREYQIEMRESDEA